MISSTFDKNKVFTVMWSEIENNLCSKFYVYIPTQLSDWVRLKSIANIDPLRQLNYTKDYINYVGLAETNDHKINNVLARPYNEVKGRKLIKNGDVLFARIEPSIFNKKYIYVNGLTDVTLSSTEFNVIEAKDPNDAKFILYMLISNPVYQQFTGKLTGSTGRRRLDKDVLKNIWIPYPSQEIRRNIVSIMDEAFLNKNAKLSQAEELLKSIDTYLLSELNLQLPELKNDLADRKYIVNSKEVIGKRLDPAYHSKQYELFLQECNEKNINLLELKDICSEIYQGVGRCLTDDNSNILLKVKNILPENKIDYSDIEYVENPPKNKQLQVGDIISPFIGEAIRQFKFSIFNNNNGNYFVDNNTGVIRVKNGYDGLYVCAILNSSIMKFQIERLIGGGVPFIGTTGAKELLIPIVDFQVQSKIAFHIQQVYDKIKNLKIEAQQCIDSARTQIEQIISGE